LAGAGLLAGMALRVVAVLEGPRSVEARECLREWVVGEEHLARHLAERGRRVLSTPCMVLRGYGEGVS